MRIFSYIVIFLSLISSSGFAQEKEYPTGLVFNTELYNRVPKKAKLKYELYARIPSRYSLKKYTPYPQSQGSIGSCTGWASTYAARTILEAVENNWTNKDIVTDHAFAPLFTFDIIKLGCNDGAYNYRAMEVLQEVGVPYFNDFIERGCRDLSQSEIDNYDRHEIEGYNRLFSTGEDKVSAVKKAISEKKPVLIGMSTPR